MSLWKIAWRSIQQRGLASFLTSLSMALGVMLVVAVLAIHGVVARSFQTNASLGYNLIVGPKGGKLQLTLNTVYYLSSPVENIPYDFYLEFLPQARRDAELKLAIRAQADETRTQTAQLQAVAASGVELGGPGMFVSLLTTRLLERAATKQRDVGRDGKFSQYTKIVIPVCLGDYFGNFRVVGTTPAMFEELRFGERVDRKYEFSAGRNFEHYNDDHGYFEAVVGATAASEQHVKLGEQIAVSHGDPEGHSHGQKFTVVGILRPSGTPNDRAVFINMEGFYLMEDHAKPMEQGAKPVDESTDESAAAQEETERAEMMARRAAAAAKNDEHDHARPVPLPVEQREVTALLVSTVNPVVSSGLQRVINKGSVAQAIFPVQEITGLFDLIVRPIQLALLIITVLICVVSGISILVSIYNSMSDRRHEIAVMRALGAGRWTVLTIILFESIMLSLAAGACGWVAAHAGIAAASPAFIEPQTGVSVGFLDVAPEVSVLELLGIDSTMELKVSPELLLVPGLIALAILVGLLPAMTAYRTDVAKSLGV